MPPSPPLLTCVRNRQCIRTFMLARATPRALATLPGVFMVLPTTKTGGKGEGSRAEADPELTGSNVYSVGEGVLLKWLFYHLEQANRVSFCLLYTSPSPRD